MDKKELLEKFHSVYSEATTSGDADDIKVSLQMFKKAFALLAEVNIRDAKELVECYEGTLHYYNFLTENEASEIVNKFANQDGSKGPRWRDPEEVFKKVSDAGLKVECEPHYNKWALYVAMNKASSDQNNFILKWVGDDREHYFEACYELAISQLKDKDCPYWIRHHYGVKDMI